MDIKLKKPKFDLSLIGISQFFVNIGSKTTSQILVLIVALLAINIISQSFFFRFDLTETKTYSLAEGTKNIISSLEDTVTIKVFFSDNVPPDLIQVKKDVKDIYEEYARFSDGKINLEVKNPNDENFKSEATEEGVPEIQYQEYSQDKYEIATGYLGASITYKDTTEVIPLITPENVQNIEYETSSRIYKLTQGEKLTIGFLTGHGEKSLDYEYIDINTLLSQEFNTEEVDLGEGEPIDTERISILVIAACSSDLSERDKFEIDQYIMNGGRVIFLVDQYQLGYGESLTMAKNESNYIEFIKQYGVEVKNSILLDESFQPLQMLFTYPYFILTQRENINTDNPALSDLDSLVFQWANPLHELKTNDDQVITSLIKTTDDAWTKVGDSISIDPADDFYPEEQSQYNLALLIEGKQISQYKDKKIPEIETSTDDEIEDKRTKKDGRVNEIEDAGIIVIGDSNFIQDDFISYSEQNAIFFMNILEWLSNSDDLTSIRSKNIVTRALKVTSESEKIMIKTINISVIPALLITFGVFYNIRRKKKSSIL